MRKKFFLTTIIAAFILCSCAEGSKTVADNMSIEEGSTANEEHSDDDSLYKDFIERIRNETEKPDASYDEEWIWDGVHNANADLGYLQEDIDGDGIDELIIGYGDSEGKLDDSFLPYIYTIKNGELYMAINSSDRSWYQLCENGIILFSYSWYNDRSSQCGYEYSKYEAGSLKLIESVVEGDVAEENKVNEYYFYTDYTSQEDTTRELTKEEFDKTVDELELKYKKLKPKIHLFKEK